MKYGTQLFCHHHTCSEKFKDLWQINRCNYNQDGYTFGHDPDLRNEYVDFYDRIDFIFAKKGENQHHDKIGPVQAIVVGDEYFNRTASGLWPSDHGGVVARMYLKYNPVRLAK